MLTYADVCRRMLTYADVCSRTGTGGPIIAWAAVEPAHLPLPLPGGGATAAGNGVLGESRYKVLLRRYRGAIKLWRYEGAIEALLRRYEGAIEALLRRY
jgi:hypothetical protein